MIRIVAGGVCMLSIMCLADPLMALTIARDEPGETQDATQKATRETPTPLAIPDDAHNTNLGRTTATEKDTHIETKEPVPPTFHEAPLSNQEQAPADSEAEEASSTNPDASVMDTVVLPIMTTAAGTGFALTGLGIGLWGLRPLMQFYQLQAALQAEESRASTDPVGATQNAFVFQAMAYQRNRQWKMFGLPMVVGGTILTLGGTVFIGTGVMGLAWGATGESE